MVSSRFWSSPELNYFFSSMGDLAFSVIVPLDAKLACCKAESQQTIWTSVFLSLVNVNVFLISNSVTVYLDLDDRLSWPPRSLLLAESLLVNIIYL